MFKKALFILTLLLAALCARLTFPAVAASIGGGEALEKVVAVLGQSLLG